MNDFIHYLIEFLQLTAWLSLCPGYGEGTSGLTFTGQWTICSLCHIPLHESFLPIKCVPSQFPKSLQVPTSLFCSIQSACGACPPHSLGLTHKCQLKLVTSQLCSVTSSKVHILTVSAARSVKGWMIFQGC